MSIIADKLLVFFNAFNWVYFSLRDCGLDCKDYIETLDLQVFFGNMTHQ